MKSTSFPITSSKLASIFYHPDLLSKLQRYSRYLQKDPHEKTIFEFCLQNFLKENIVSKQNLFKIKTFESKIYIFGIFNISRFSGFIKVY